jgi:hypothetical protein
MDPALRCSFCQSVLAYVHGHATCVDNRCPQFGANQAECCSGETAQCGPAPTRAPAEPPHRGTR